MCLTPIKFRNPSRYISNYGGQLFDMELPCGQCCECKKATQTEWLFRSFYQCKYTLDNNGYIYFDTLTYAPKYLPHISEFCKEVKAGSDEDFSCFRPSDWRYFLNNLRRQIDYYYKGVGFDTKLHFKYFMSSEYGTSDSGTHRPHYHVLFYITNNVLSPEELSKLVSKCWKFGRTDGIEYNGIEQVKKHTYRSDNLDLPHLLNVCNYVSKYVVKDSIFQKVLDARIKYIDDNYSSEFGKKKRKSLVVNNISQFHRQSQGFGEFGIKYNSIDDIFDTGMMKMPDINNVWKYAPLSGYLKRKLFQVLVVNEKGNREWIYNELGQEYLCKRLDKGIDLYADKMQEWHDNIGIYVKDSDKQKEIIDKVDSIKGSRSWRDYAVYMRLYKGRVKPRDMYGVFPSENLMKQYIMKYYRQRWYDDEDSQYISYGYGTCYDRIRFGSKFVCSKDLGRVENGISRFLPNVQNWICHADEYERIHGFRPGFEYMVRNKGFVGLASYGVVMKQSLFSFIYVINQDTYKEFNGFDDIYSIWKDSMKDYNNEKQRVYDEKQRLNHLYKEKGKRKF